LNKRLESALKRLQDEQKEQEHFITFRKGQIYEALARLERNGKELADRNDNKDKHGDIIKVIDIVNDNTVEACNLTRKTIIFIKKQDIIRGSLKEVKRKITTILEEQNENDRQ